MQKGKHLIKVRRARRSFLILYLMSLIVIGFLAYSYYSGKKPDLIVLIISIGFVYFIVKFSEYKRIRDWWAITDNSLIESTGIFNKNVREVDFSSISDLDLEQPFLKRILNYGDVNVRLFLNETSIKINNINKPKDFIEELQKIISMNRNQKYGPRKI